jgi:hypothetical protein
VMTILCLRMVLSPREAPLPATRFAATDLCFSFCASKDMMAGVVQMNVVPGSGYSN